MLGIQAERHRRDLSLQQMADFMDISSSTLRSIERKGQLPNYRTLVKMQDVLGMDIEDMFAEVELSYSRKD
ncbi:MAG: helix-turn-helix domain-containing protein [Eubacteriaceae bacterium]|nr:helix-turn-helix domain-containing protein [Eubacteriaceae bacterium]